MAHDRQQLTPHLRVTATLCSQTPAAAESPLWLGVDLGTCDIVLMVVDCNGRPVAIYLDWVDMVHDGIVWDFFGTVTTVRCHLDTLEQQPGHRLSHVATSFPPGTDSCISTNVLEFAELEVNHVLDELITVTGLLQLDNVGVVDIGGGTIGIAIVRKGRVTYLTDEATGGHHISLALAGDCHISLEEAERYKCDHGDETWFAVKPVYEKMADIVARRIEGQGVTDLWLAGDSCMQPGVIALFCKQFPTLQVHLPQYSLFMTPLAIASSGREEAKRIYAKRIINGTFSGVRYPKSATGKNTQYSTGGALQSGRGEQLRAAGASAWVETSVRDGRQFPALGRDDRRVDTQPGR